MGALESNKLLRGGYHSILTGYIGSASFLEEVANWVDEISEYNGDVRYFCDPVLGDDGRLYAPEEMVKVYRDTILPRAWCISPN